MKISKLLLKINLMVFSSLLSQYVYAAGYQLFEQDVSDLGRSYAGGAATADNAVIEFDNPAGMTQINTPSLSLSGAVIAVHSRFTGDSATNILHGADIYSKANVKRESPLGTNEIVALHYIHPLGEKLRFGFGITEPFGLDSNYDSEGMARYFATKSKIVTFNFNPSLGYAITDKFSVGAGASAQHITANLDRKLDAGAILESVTNVAKDVNIENTANDWAYGFNLGLLYKFTQDSIFGLSYRSEIHHKPSGDLKVQYPAALSAREIAILEGHGYKDGTVKTNLNLPETAIASFFQRFNEHWNGEATVSFTHWSRFNDLKLVYNTGMADTVVHENFHESWRFCLGTDYRINDKWLVRFGTAYDNSPVDDQNRNVALPDSDRFWLSTGANYRFNRNITVDLAYAHLFLKSGTVYDYDATGKMTLHGHYNNSYANLFGLQLNWAL